MSQLLSLFQPIAMFLHNSREARPKLSLAVRCVAGLSLLLVLSLPVIFLTAGTWDYWQGWVYLGVLFLPAAGAYAYFFKHDPELLERRMRQKESAREQAQLIRWFKPLFLAAFLLPGFDHRSAWSRRFLGDEPLTLTLFAQIMALGGMLFALAVVNVNRFAGRTIQVEADQPVISTGPYRFVRHPMYAGSVVLWLFTPLALDSPITVPAFALLVPFYVVRLLNEEKLLRAELPGYTEFCQRTRYRLIPFVW